MQCCGGALDRVGQRESSLAFCRRKLHDLQNHDVDALIVVCPSCFQQFDLNQAALQRANENVNVPVLYLSELIDLAYGHEPEEIGLDMHRVSVKPFLDKWAARTADKAALALALRRRAPQQVRRLPRVQGRLPGLQGRRDLPAQRHHLASWCEGDLEGVIARGEFWKCLECYTCLEMCHSEIGMAETFRSLKEIALREGPGPSPSPSPTRCSSTPGTLGEPKQGARKKLGLEPLPASGGDVVPRMMACELDTKECE